MLIRNNMQFKKTSQSLYALANPPVGRKRSISFNCARMAPQCWTSKEPVSAHIATPENDSYSCHRLLRVIIIIIVDRSINCLCSVMFANSASSEWFDKRSADCCNMLYVFCMVYYFGCPLIAADQKYVMKINILLWWNTLKLEQTNWWR